AHTELHHNWMDTDYAFPSLTKIPRGGAKRQKRVEKTGTSQRKDGTADCVHGTFANVGIKWGVPMSDSNFTQVLNIVAEAAGISRNLLGDEIWFTSHCFRRGGAQYRFMFAPEERRWSLKLVKWWVGWAPSEKAETVTRYLLDDVLDREENQLGDSLAPDSISCTNAALQGLQDFDYGCSQPDDTDSNDLSAPFGDASRDVLAPLSHSIVDDIKQTIVEGLRDVVKIMGLSQDAVPTQPGDCEESAATEAQDTSNLVSELPDAKSWRDYVDQYWKPNPACHQYRAGVNMLPHERKVHRSRLSRMKIIAEFIRDEFGGDKDLFENSFATCVRGDLTVNKILAAIRNKRTT
ncbi:hypothetical protein PHMEG_00025827, partial [Phytophthora megakarya]